MSDTLALDQQLFLHHLNVQLNSFSPKIDVCIEITLDFGDGFGGAAEMVMFSFSLVMMVSNVAVRLKWLLNSDKTMFSKPSTSPSSNSALSARSLHNTRST